MNRAYFLTAAISLCAVRAHAKDVPVPPAEYRMFNVYASRGHEKQCVALTSAKELVARFTALGVNKPEAVLGLIDPPVDWQQSAVLLLYQPDPPPDVVPKVRALLKDVNREKLTVLFRYADPNAPEPGPPAPESAQAEPNKPRPAPAGFAAGFTLKAYTVGTDDTRDRAGFRSPLLLVVIPSYSFLRNKPTLECTQKL
ncbi:MAG: hypothetical protein U1A78_11035 [Polyangia bacterium]